MPCGVSGFVGRSDRDLLRKMCEAIHHRGPDSTGYYLDGNVGLGIDRLKIIDLVTGDQPIHNEDGSVWTVFNGEIYNYLELRTELESRGHRFYTESDTETVVHAYEEWRDDCVLHFRGMFAFALWDSKSKRLYVARDRFGKKPLYYRLADDAFFFASEIKSLLQDDSLRRRINREAVDFFFTYMYVPSPLSIFEGIHKLPPGHFGVYESGVLSVKQYWDFVIAPYAEADENAIVEELYRTIKRAVQIRMKSDVPLGAFLSGGIDSSAVVSIMCGLSDIPVNTVSIGFDDALSEVRYSKQVADFLGTDHHEFTVTPDAHKILPTLIWHFDEPFADHSMIPTYYLSQVTRKEVTVALSGDGGDELFMGYGFLRDPSSYAFYSKIPAGVRTPLLRLILSLPASNDVKKRANHAYEKNYGSQSPSERYAMRMSLYNPAGLRRLYSKSLLNSRELSNPYSYVSNLVERGGSSDLLDAISYATIKSYLEEDILVKVDRMSMANSLEVRCPLLDQELAEFAGRIPSSLKLKGGTTKYILKRMVRKKGLLPAEITQRKKQGFGAPIESWMKNEWKEVINQQLDPVITNNYTGFFDREYVKKLLAQPHVNANKLFALGVFVLWYQMYIEEHAVTAPNAMVA